MIRVQTAARLLRTGLLALALSGCIDPLVSDEVPVREDEVFPQAEAPLLETDEALLAQVDLYDGVGRVVPRLSAFASGKRVWYWPFGETTRSAIPIYILADRTAGGDLVAREDHLPIIDSLPGDEGYSPFWEIYFLEVTPKWTGQTITSFAAVQDAQRLGLVLEPEQPQLYINCPVVHPDVRLETRDGLQAPSLAYYRGLRVPVYTFEILPVLEDGTVASREALQLRREGGEPLDEWWRNVDMTGDGDINDTNTVFRVGLEAADYTPLWQMVNVVVPSDYQSVDTSGDEKVADAMDFGDLFGLSDGNLVATAGKVIAYEVTETFVNCPLEPPAP